MINSSWVINHYPYDKFAQNVMSAFFRVLQRPRFGITIQPLPLPRPNLSIYGSSFLIEGFEEKFQCDVFVQRNGIQLILREIPADSNPLFFCVLFKRDKPKNVRKVALNFVEKLRNKKVYDVLNV